MADKLSRLSCFLFVLLLALFTAAANAAPTQAESSADTPSHSKDTQIWVTSVLYQPWNHPPPNPPAWWARRADGWEMFTEDGLQKWERVLGKVDVIAISGNSVQNACLENHTSSSPKTCADLGRDPKKSLDQMFRFLRAHHISSALEIGLLVDTQVVPPSTLNASCGREAFAREVALRAVLQKIKNAGGNLDLIRMDEPFWYGTMSCKDTAEQVAQNLRSTIENIVRPYFPDVRIGDAEPLGARPDGPALLGKWADAYRAATGEPLAFFQIDPGWGSSLVFNNLAEAAKIAKGRSIPYGIMYTADNDRSDESWTQSAIDHFTTAESYFHIHVDQADFQSWTKFPAFMLPEQKPGTLLNVAYQYLLPKTYLSIVGGGGNDRLVRIKLADVEHKPLAGAKIRVEAVDTRGVLPMTNRVMQGTVPDNAVYGVVGIRANLEGTKMFAEHGEVTLGAISVATSGNTWRSTYATPYKIELSPTATLARNLSLPGEQVCKGTPVIAVSGGEPYTLGVPMSATATADHAGYVTIVFLDGACNGVRRDNLYFTPSSRSLDLASSQTNTAGELAFSVPPFLLASGGELRAYYDGDNVNHRPALDVVSLGERGD